MLFLARTESVNKRIKLHSSDIRGTNYGEKVAHRKILEWQVMNKNINNSATTTTVQFYSRKATSPSEL